MFPDIQVILVDKNPVSASKALARQQKLKLSKLKYHNAVLTAENLKIANEDIYEWKCDGFQLGLAIHSCGALCKLAKPI